MAPAVRAALPMGSFELLDIVGRGGMAVVRRGVHRPTGARVAVKVVTDAKARTPHQIARFHAEARAMASMGHPHIVMVLDSGEVSAEAASLSSGALHEGSPYMVLEYASGGSLHRFTDPGGVDLGWERLREALLAMLSALSHAHARGFVHRDIKASNILICDERDPRPGYKLTDFGIVHVVDNTEQTGQSNRLAGTTSYMAPEQVLGQWRDYGPWTDLYALGCTAFELATCMKPFTGKTRFDVMDAHVQGRRADFRPLGPFPEGLEGWLDRMMARNPGDRFRRATDAADALRALDGSSVGGGDSLGGWERAVPLTPPGELVFAGLGLFGFREAPFVDRDDERDLLWEGLRRARAERSVEVFLIEGAAGHGKSRLAEWLCVRAHEVGAARVLKATHDPAQGPMDGIAPMIARGLGCQKMPRTRLRDRLAETLGAWGLGSTEMCRSLEALLSPVGADEESGLDTLAFEDPRERYALMTSLLPGLTGGRTLILWLDDVAWGLDALGFVEYLCAIRDVVDAPVVVVMTARSEALAEQPVAAQLLDKLEAEASMRRLEIGALPVDRRGEMIGGLIGLEPALARQVEERTEGNPLFIAQLISDWVERSLLVPGAGGFALRSGEAPRVPDDVHALWSSRVERLLAGRSPDDAEALELAAVLGRDVDVAEWQDACAVARRHPTEDLTEALVASRLAIVDPADPGGRWWFAHGLLRDSLERRAREAGRQARHHQDCARALQAIDGPRAAERVARHLHSAGDTSDALDPLTVAIRDRLAVCEFADARRLLADWDVWVEAAAIAEDDPRRAAGWVLRADLGRSTSDFEACLSWSRLAYEASVKHGWPEVGARARRLMGRAARERGEPERAREWLREAEERAEALGDRLLLAECRSDAGMLLMYLGEIKDAEAMFHRALSDARSVDSQRWIGQACYGLSYVCQTGGRLAEARRWLTQAQAAFERCGARVDGAHCLNSLGEVLRREGRFVEAEAAYREAADRLKLIGTQSRALVMANVGLTLVEQGRYDEARMVLEVCVATALRQNWTAVVGFLNVCLLPCVAHEEDWEAWDVHLGRATEALENTRYVDRDCGNMALLGGRVAAAAGEPERALGALRLAAHHFEATDRTDDLETTQALIAQAAAVVRGTPES